MSMVTHLKIDEEGFKSCNCPACGKECNVHDSEFNAKIKNIKNRDKEYDEYSVECTNCHQIFYASQCY